MQVKSLFVVVVLVLAIVSIHHAQARPSRVKRVSDQRLAEIEALLALSKYRGMLSTVPVGYGKIDYNKIGRRRRAATLLWRELLDASNEPDSGDLRDDSEELMDDVRSLEGNNNNNNKLEGSWGGDSPHI